MLCGRGLPQNLAVWTLLITRVLHGLKECEYAAYFSAPGKELLYTSGLTVLMAHLLFVNSPWVKERLDCYQHLRFRLSLIFSGELKNGCPGGLDWSIRWYDETNDLYKSCLSGLGCSPAKLRAHVMHLQSCTAEDLEHASVRPYTIYIKKQSVNLTDKYTNICILFLLSRNTRFIYFIFFAIIMHWAVNMHWF